MPRLGSAKSRRGCTQCKSRKVKCDENAPCRNCLRRGEGCSLQRGGNESNRVSAEASVEAGSVLSHDHFSPQRDNSFAIQSPSSSATTSRLSDQHTPCSLSSTTASRPLEAAASTSSDVLSPLTATWLQDLSLMHHWTQTACFANLGLGVRFQYIWQSIIPQTAVNHPFLMHGLLALSALHLVSLQNSLSSSAVKFLRLSDNHQAAALKTYRNTLASRTEKDSDALFAFSVVLPGTSRARAVLRVREGDENAMPLSEIAEHISLIRGISDVVGAVHEAVARGPFSVLLYGHEMPTTVKVILSASMTTLLADLDAMVREHCGEETLELCTRALACLRKTFEGVVYHRSLDGGEGELKMSHIWRSIVDLPYEYFVLVHDAYPPALVITAHFCVATVLLDQGSRSIWLAASWGRFAFEGILVALNGLLGRHIVWAKEQVATEAMGLRGEAAGRVQIDGRDGVGESPSA